MLELSQHQRDMSEVDSGGQLVTGVVGPGVEFVSYIRFTVNEGCSFTVAFILTHHNMLHI